MAQDYDVSLKYLIDHFTEDYARLIFGNVGAKIELLDRELAATKHYVDALAQVTIGNETFIFHPEFVGDYDKDLPERMYKYSARIMDKYPGLAVYGAVFYINENARNKALPNIFTRSILGKVRSLYAFDVIKVWELDAATILREHITGLLPLVPLMKYPLEETENIVREAVQQLQQNVHEPELRGETFSALYLFSGLRKLKSITQKVLKEANMLEFLKKSEAYQDILSEGREEGRTEGRTEGEAQGVIRSILAILGARFGQLPQDFSESLKPLQISTLSDLVVKAMSIENLTAFAALVNTLRETKANGTAHHAAN